MDNNNIVSRLGNLRRAAYPLIWIETHEPDRAVEAIRDSAPVEGAKVYGWDCERGIVEHLPPLGINVVANDPDPAAPIRFAADRAETDSVVVARNYHMFLRGNPILIQALANAAGLLKAKRVMLAVVAPVTEIPTEVERLFTSLRMDLPDADHLRAKLDALADSVEAEGGKRPDTSDPSLIEAASGLTELEAENAFALSYVEGEGKITADEVFDRKAEQVRRNGKLAIYKGGERLGGLGGFGALKRFCLAMLAGKNAKARPRGALLLGVPGTGKSHFAKSLAAEVGRPCLTLDMGALFGGIVGESEKNVRAALAVAYAMAPAVLFIDEIEKGLSGSASSGQTDGGTSARVFGTFLSWLQDHKSEVFVLATCNDVTKLPPEFARAERWDALFFVDLPRSESEREDILVIQRREFGLTEKSGRPPAWDGWTGAEIRAACRIAACSTDGLTIAEAAEYVVPVTTAAREQVDALRRWAEGRCVDAHLGGRYSMARQGTDNAAPAGGRRLKIAK